MEKKSQLLSAPLQLAKIVALLVLSFLALLVPSSLRQPYLYLLFNALVITLGVEAGFLAAISGPPRDDKKPPSRMASPNLQVKQPSVSNARLVSSTAGPTTNTPTTTQINSPNNLLADAVLAKDVIAVIDTMNNNNNKKKIMKKCPSRTSIFFIGSVDSGEDCRWI